MPSAGSRQDRGYGRAHELQRKAWAPRVKRGEVKCARCDQLIRPNDEWDLGHTDDRTAWSGPEHRGCNRRAGAANSHAVRRGLKHSRTW
jgi:hypothetical protein